MDYEINKRGKEGKIKTKTTKSIKKFPTKKGHGRQIKKGKRNQRVSPPPKLVSSRKKRMTMLPALPTGFQSVGPSGLLSLIRPWPSVSCNLQSYRACTRTCSSTQVLNRSFERCVRSMLAQLMFWNTYKKMISPCHGPELEFCGRVSFDFIGRHRPC